jgi:hypothetical protein
MDLDHERLDVYHLALDFPVLASEIIAHFRSSNWSRTIDSMEHTRHPIKAIFHRPGTGTGTGTLTGGPEPN